ncbi:hypothetical protein JVU11DRAFT_1705 [Chiua virens]|nr:hypothetical protein JVU11DRAFT_1705 [Chiua virens]
METPSRIPLEDLPLERFLTSGTASGAKTPRKHKRPLSPSRTTPLNPSKRRVLDAKGNPLSSHFAISSPSQPVPFMLSNIHTVTPTRPSRLGNGLVRNHGSSRGTPSPLPSRRPSPSRELYPKPTVESCTNPQSRHYPGFDIFRDSEPHRNFLVPAASLPLAVDAQVDKAEEDKENVPLKRRAKKLSWKKRLSSRLDGPGPSRLSTHPQTSKVIHSERMPLSACQALR